MIWPALDVFTVKPDQHNYTRSAVLYELIAEHTNTKSTMITRKIVVERIPGQSDEVQFYKVTASDGIHLLVVEGIICSMARGSCKIP